MSPALKAAQAEAGKYDGLTVAEKDGLLIYSARGVDLIARSIEHPSAYRVLCDCPKHGVKPGDGHHVSLPYDEQAAITARELAAGLEVG